MGRYRHLDEVKNKIQAAKSAPDQSFEKSLKARVNSFGGEDQLSWIYGNNIEEVWKNFVADQRSIGKDEETRTQIPVLPTTEPVGA